MDRRCSAGFDGVDRADSGQSFTIPTLCTDAGQCAAFCRGAVEHGRAESDFIALAAYQLGPLELPRPGAGGARRSENSRWRNRAEFFQGRPAIEAFLTRKWNRELDYRLIKELWAFH